MCEKQVGENKVQAFLFHGDVEKRRLGDIMGGDLYRSTQQRLTLPWYEQREGLMEWTEFMMGLRVK